MKNEIKLHPGTIEEIIDMLKQYQDVEEFHLTDWNEFLCTEDRLSYAKSYIEIGQMINHLKEKLNERA